MILPSAFESLAQDLTASELSIPCEVSVAGEIITGISCIPGERKIRMEIDQDTFVVAGKTQFSIARNDLPGVPGKQDRIWASGKIWRIDEEPTQTSAGMLVFSAITVIGFY